MHGSIIYEIMLKYLDDLVYKCGSGMIMNFQMLSDVLDARELLDKPSSRHRRRLCLSLHRGQNSDPKVRFVSQKIRSWHAP